LFIERIIEAVERLETFPEMGRRVQEAEEENIREIIFQNYRLETEQVLILTILHAARDFNKTRNAWVVNYVENTVLFWF